MRQTLDMVQHQSQIVSQSQVQFLQILAMCNQEMDVWMTEQYNENPFLERTEHENVAESNGNIHMFSNARQSQSLDSFHYQEPAVFEGQDIRHILLEQLDHRKYSRLEWNVFSLLIDHLEETGFFLMGLDTLSFEHGIPLPVLEKCLGVLQNLEPYGIFSKDIKGCFLKQLEKGENWSFQSEISHSRQLQSEMTNGHSCSRTKKKNQDNISKATLLRIVNEDFEDLIYKKISRLQKKYKISGAEINEYHQILSHLRPCPLHGFGYEKPVYIRPDIICKVENGNLVPYLNEKENTSFSLSDYYFHLMNTAVDSVLKSYLRDRYQSARNLLTNVENRKNTLLRIASAILERQSGFFLYKDMLLPMSMKEISEACSLSISTISRAVRDKYIQYPHGTVAMRDLFIASAETAERTSYSLSPEEAKKAIVAIIQSEDPKQPFNDDEIAARLQEQAIFLSRRTVAKYRKELCIPTSRERRER